LKLDESLLANIERSIAELQDYVSEQKLIDDDSELHRQQIAAVLLIARICQISKAALLVIKAGLNNEARSIFRIFLDAYFVFGAVCSDKSCVREYFATDFAARMKLINVAEKHNSEIFSLIKERILDGSRDELKCLVNKENIQEFKTFNFANKCGCNHIFDSMYRVCSASVHSTPRSLVPYMITDGDSIVGIEFNPAAEDVPQVAYDLVCFLIKVYSGVTEVFGTFDETIIEEKRERLEAIVNKT